MTNQDLPLTGRVAIVTGSARNIGRTIALRLAADGAAVVVNAVQDSAAADAVAHEISKAGGQAMAHVADVTNEEAVQKMVGMAATAFGRIDIMVSNASVRGQVPIEEMSLEEWHRVLAVPLDGAFLLSKACIPHMKKNNWGRIITLGGISAYIGTKNRAHLLAAKAGLVGFTRGIAAEVADRGITCNVVSPGHIDTDRPASAGVRPPLVVRPPIDRFGRPDEVASMVRYLCLPEAAYITGQTMHVNGGLYMGV
ncbi:MAG: 3-oxoacyl-ACP reductase FabG [Rhodospirillales bacterium]|nr:3-oxoacyl-ACP reductase FabG [Rhodospirillales bacterium]